MADHKHRVRRAHGPDLLLQMLHAIWVHVIGRLIEQHNVDWSLEAGPNMHELKLAPAEAVQTLTHQGFDPIGQATRISPSKSKQLLA